MNKHDYVIVATGDFTGRVRTETITMQTNPMNALKQFMDNWKDSKQKTEIRDVMINRVA